MHSRQTLSWQPEIGQNLRHSVSSHNSALLSGAHGNEPWLNIGAVLLLVLAGFGRQTTTLVEGG